MKNYNHNHYENLRRNYRIRDFFKPNVAELMAMVLEVPFISIPNLLLSRGTGLGALETTIATLAPQALTYIAGRGLELVANTRKESSYLWYWMRKGKVPHKN